MSIKIYGVNLSPYVRKVRMALAVKGLEYEHISVMPRSPDQPAEFIENSPLGKIPLGHIDGVWLPDSSVILSYLERSRLDTPLLDSDPKLAARALWFEEYSDSHMTSVISGHLFAELILAPFVFKRESNQAEIDLARNEEIPAIYDYIESQLSHDFLLGDSLGHADVCLGCNFITLLHCQESCNSTRWPKTAAYIDRVVSEPVFSAIIAEEQAFLKAVSS